MNVLGMPPGCLAALIGIVGFVFALILFFWISGREAGTDVMKEISEHSHGGAMVFLRREYSILVIFIAVAFALLFWNMVEKVRRQLREIKS